MAKKQQDSIETINISIPLAESQQIREQMETVARLEKQWFEIVNISLNPEQHNGKNVMLLMKDFFNGVIGLQSVDTTADKQLISQYATRLSKVRSFEAFQHTRQAMLATAKELVARLENDLRSPHPHMYPRLDELQTRYSRDDAQAIHDTLEKQIHAELERHKRQFAHDE